MSFTKLNAGIIEGFSNALLHKNYDRPVETPPCHREWWELVTSDHPRIAVAAPRRHAKSTAITLAYVLACVLFRERSYVIIISDTITQACQFLGDIRRAIDTSDELKKLFKIEKFLKETEDDIEVVFEDGHSFKIQARGSGQSMRGLKWNNKRPDLIVGDDLENDEIVMNKDRRDKFKRWFYAAVIPAVSSNGVIRVIGTILHEDSFLNNLMPSEYNRRCVVEPLKTYLTNVRVSEWLAIKYRAHTDDFTKILWESNYTKDYFIDLRKNYLDRGIPDAYSQEYLNIPIDDSVAFFKRTDFKPLDTEDKKKRLNYYVTADLAISKDQQADYSVFIVAGVDENKVIQIKHVIRERMDSREIVDTIFALQEAYQPICFGIEEMQVSKAIGPFLREEMVRRAVYPNVELLKHMGLDKVARAKTMQARVRAGGVKVDKDADWYPVFEDELAKFPRATKDDQVDAFAYLGRMLDSMSEAATDKEIEEEEYYGQLRESRTGSDGRSKYTGY